MADEKNDMREILAATGHSTLKAFLTVSGGAAVAFLAFLGAVFKEPQILERIGAASASTNSWKVTPHGVMSFPSRPAVPPRA